MHRGGWSILGLVVACSAPAPREDDAPEAGSPAERSCAELQRGIRDALPALDRTCAVAEDCEVFGAAWSCDCTPHLAPGCSGIAVTRGAPAAHPVIGPYEREFFARCREVSRAVCDQLGCSCDCYPARAECVDGTCQTVEQHRCFADAGV